MGRFESGGVCDPFGAATIHHPGQIDGGEGLDNPWIYGAELAVFNNSCAGTPTLAIDSLPASNGLP